jgi:hypothetical protein
MRMKLWVTFPIDVYLSISLHILRVKTNFSVEILIISNKNEFCGNLNDRLLVTNLSRARVKILVSPPYSIKYPQK